MEIIWKKGEERWWAAGTSRVDVPGLFLACKGSNKVAKSIVQKCFGTFINLESDSLWVNSLRYEDWVEHFMDLGDILYNLGAEYLAEVGADADTPCEEELKKRALFRIKRLMVTWELWGTSLDNEGGRMMLGRYGSFLNDFVNLEELTLVFVEYVRDEEMLLFRDDRQLRLEDVEDMWGVRNCSTAEEVCPG